MSFSKTARKVRANDGNQFPEGGTTSFAIAIAKALEEEFGTTPSKIKVVARLTGTNEKTVKNWFCARNGPSGESLVALMQHSEIVLQLVLHLTGHNDLLEAMKIAGARKQLQAALSALGQLLGDEEGDSAPSLSPSR